jgi:hypothetical protein
MSWELDATDWTRQLSSPLHDGNNPKSLRASIAAAISMSLSLTTAGRLGFFIDYSELSDAGTHTFYVARTHGSTGAVSVAYATSGDGHTSVSGVLSWADEDMSIQSFTVAVTPAQLTNHQTTLGLGEHRIVARLSNPTGGGVLHFGTEETKAYGVIDNNVLASDANAVFYDSAAATAGNGTQASPYDSIYTALANIGTKRYLYGKGTTIVDETYKANVLGVLCNALPIPPTRTSEANRVYIRNWPSNTWTVTGTGTISAGFHTETSESYQTFKGIDFSNLNNSTGSNGFGIFYQYGSSASVNIELCSANNINGLSGSNNGAYMLWGVDGGKVWRCTGNNIQTDGDNTNQNTAMFFTFDGVNISVQRCEATNASKIVYHKRVLAPFTVSTSVRFCKDSTPYGVLYTASGSSGVPHAYTVVQCNVFLPTGGNNTGITHDAGSQGLNGSNNGGKHWWCNNVFYQRGGGVQAAIQFRQAYNAIIFNNIMLDCRKVWADYFSSIATGPAMEYADYQLHFGTTLVSQTYEYEGTDCVNVAELQLLRPDFAGNDEIQDPLFIDAGVGDFTLQEGSPALNGGISNTQQGVYLGDFYTIGAN